jgi:hypothetical protein
MGYVPQSNEGLTNPNAYVSKDSYETLYFPMTFKWQGDTALQLSSFANSYFMNPLLVGSKAANSSGAKLQVTGDINTSGSLGIGLTTEPSAQLHTTGSVRFAGLTNNNTPTRVLVSDANGTLYYRDASTLASSDIIGSSLAINGPAKARSLTLSTTVKDWPDFVFDSSYQKMDLQAVHNYVRQHHHLPGIASASDIADKGINVAENQAALLKKIEELTLYAVDQDNTIKHQQQQIDCLISEVEHLKKKIDTPTKAAKRTTNK